MKLIFKIGTILFLSRHQPRKWMSRGFVREGDQEEPIFIPPRAPLPGDVTNYVTPKGMEKLLAEKQQLEAARDGILQRGAAVDEDERRRELAILNGRLDLLQERIATARVVEHEGNDPQEVRFGTRVTFLHETGPLKGKRFTFSIVGVDEADIKQGTIAFTAPIAKALMGKRTGEVAELRLGPSVQRSKIIAIDIH